VDKSPASFHAPQRQNKEQPENSAFPAIFSLATLPASLPKFFVPCQAKLIKAGSDIIFQVHYTPHGTPLAINRGSASSLPMSHRKSVSLHLVRPPMAHQNSPGHPNYRVDSNFVVAPM